MDSILQLNYLKEKAITELEAILHYWIKNTPDKANGGFVGRIDDQDQVHPEAPKGAVLNARILWSFSAAYQINAQPVYLEMADRAFRYLKAHFIDQEYGGVYWTVDHLGNPLNTKKQVYAIAFTIYALSEYHQAKGDEEAKAMAIAMYHLLVEKNYDKERTGYMEAFTREWQPITDLRLSAKDANEKKTMNTHLHVLEAYSNLYKIWPDEGLKRQLQTLIENFLDHIILAETGHQVLFFDEDWNRRSDSVSYGHDIEASWLLPEAAEIIGDEKLLARLKPVVLKMVEVTQAGLDSDGGLWYEFEPAKDNLIKQKHWWVQAEAVVGFFNAWQLSGEDRYLEIARNNLNFTDRHIIDKDHGEWLWGIDEHYQPMPGEDKAGLWKCPYHNSRMCIELIKRINLK